MKPGLMLAGILALLALLAGGCNPTIVILGLPEKTALENQVLGTYEYLRRDDRFLAAVPGVDVRGDMSGLTAADAPPESLSLVRQNVLKAVLHQEYQRDELLQIKAAGFVGEANTGYLFVFASRLPAADRDRQRVERIAADENTDRRTIVDGVISMNPNLSESDRPQVEAVFARLYRDGARTGDWVQTSSGQWEQMK